MSYQRYIYCLFAAMALACLTVGGFNWFIDPYGFFGSPRVSGINAAKPDMGLHERPLKSYVLANRQPDGLILGASRSGAGLNPEHPGWETRNNYNSGLGAANMEMAYHYLLHARHFNTPKQVVVGLEFAMFNPVRQLDASFNRNLLAVDIKGQRNPKYVPFHRLATTISPSMTRSSLGTFMLNRTDPQYSNAAEDFQLAINDAGVMNPAEFSVNKWAGFRFRFHRTARSYPNRWWYPVEQFSVATGPGGNPEMEWYRQLLQVAHRDNTDLRLIISPVHAYLLETKRIVGLFDTWLEWKQALVELNEAIAEENDSEPFPIWDFSGYTPYTTEVVSTSNADDDKPRWYWDPGHYRAELGSLMLEQVFQQGRTGTMLPGVQVTSANIAEHNRRIMAAGAAYRADHADEVSELEAALEADRLTLQ